MNQEIREFVMMCKLSTGETLVGVLGSFSPESFMICFPYEIKDGRIGSEYCQGTLNRVFPLPIETVIFAKSLKDYLVSEYISLCHLDNDDFNEFSDAFLEGNHFEDDEETFMEVDPPSTSMVH